MSLTISLNPYQKACLISEFADLVEHPPDKDVVIRNLSQKSANEQPLIQGDLVISGKDTLAKFPRTVEYPVHFRKTYYPTSFHLPATLERDKHEKIAKILDLPAPLGASRNCFRSCFVSGTPLDQLSPFGIEPEVRNLDIAEKCETAVLIGVWKLLEDLYRQLEVMHAAGFGHGDLWLHNVIVSKSPISLFMIDFADAFERAPDLDDENWEERCQTDFVELIRHALWIQAGLGAQPGRLGEISGMLAPRNLTETSERCLEKINRHSLI